MNIWLDDVRQAPEGWVHAKNIEDIEKIIDIAKSQNTGIDKISLDFHLSHPKNGLDVLRLLAKNAKEIGLHLWPKEFLYHTNDPEGEKLMRDFVNEIEEEF